MASWLDVDWDSTDPPSAALLAESRQSLQFQPVRTGEDHFGLVSAFRAARPEGGCLLARFRVLNADATAQWFLSRDRFAAYGFADLLLRSAALRESLPELRIQSLADVDLGDGVLSDAPYVRALTDMPREPGIFRRQEPLQLDGDLALALMFDGPSRPVHYRAAHAKQLAVAFAADVMTDRYEEFFVQYSHEWWAPWFGAVVWDGTWIITDKRNQAVTILCVTDDG